MDFFASAVAAFVAAAASWARTNGLLRRGSTKGRGPPAGFSGAPVGGVKVGGRGKAGGDGNGPDGGVGGGFSTPAN